MLSPTSKVRLARLTLRGTASDCRLGGRTDGVLVRVGGADVTDEGRPVTDRLPDWRVEKVDIGDGEDDGAL